MMSSWWRKFAESIGVPTGNKSWRVKAIQHLALTDEDLALGESEITNGVVHNGDPVFYEGVRVVHNG